MAGHPTEPSRHAVRVCAMRTTSAHCWRSRNKTDNSGRKASAVTCTASKRQWLKPWRQLRTISKPSRTRTTRSSWKVGSKTHYRRHLCDPSGAAGFGAQPPRCLGDRRPARRERLVPSGAETRKVRHSGLPAALREGAIRRVQRRRLPAKVRGKPVEEVPQTVDTVKRLSPPTHAMKLVGVSNEAHRRLT